MDLTANDLLETAPDPAFEGGKEGASLVARAHSNDARACALDASGPLWPLALNGWMSLDRLPARLMDAIRAHAKAAAVPASRSGAAP
jgi:hypothetical protein